MAPTQTTPGSSTASNNTKMTNAQEFTNRKKGRPSPLSLIRRRSKVSDGWLRQERAKHPQTGHFYFAQNRTFLFCVDRLMFIRRFLADLKLNKDAKAPTGSAFRVLFA